MGQSMNYNIVMKNEVNIKDDETSVIFLGFLSLHDLRSQIYKILLKNIEFEEYIDIYSTLFNRRATINDGILSFEPLKVLHYFNAEGKKHFFIFFTDKESLLDKDIINTAFLISSVINNKTYFKNIEIVLGIETFMMEKDGNRIKNNSIFVAATDEKSLIYLKNVHNFTKNIEIIDNGFSSSRLNVLLPTILYKRYKIPSGVIFIEFQDYLPFFMTNVEMYLTLIFEYLNCKFNFNLNLKKIKESFEKKLSIAKANKIIHESSLKKIKDAGSNDYIF